MRRGLRARRAAVQCALAMHSHITMYTHVCARPWPQDGRSRCICSNALKRTGACMHTRRHRRTSAFRARAAYGHPCRHCSATLIKSQPSMQLNACTLTGHTGHSCSAASIVRFFVPSRDTGRYREIQKNMLRRPAAQHTGMRSAYAHEIQGDTGTRQGDAGRCREMRGDTRRCAEGYRRIQSYL